MSPRAEKLSAIAPPDNAATRSPPAVSDSEGIRTPAGRAQWISSPPLSRLGHAVRAKRKTQATPKKKHNAAAPTSSQDTPLKSRAQIPERRRRRARRRSKENRRAGSAARKKKDARSSRSAHPRSDAGAGYMLSLDFALIPIKLH